jgi:hypothetical protein
MKILTNPVFDWETCALESAVVTDYDGPLLDCKSGGSAPPPPDPYATAAAQTGTNQATAGYNNAITHGNTTTPIGSQTYTGRVDPTTGATVYDQSIALDPTQQKLFDQQNQQNVALGNTAQGMLNQVDQSYQHPVDTMSLPGLMSGADVNGQPPLQGSINTSGVPGLQSNLDFSNLPALMGANDLQGARSQVQDALYNQQAHYLDPQWQQSNAAQESRLKNQGITQGSEAWNNEMDRQARAQEAAYGQARNSAITGSGAELSNLANIALANRGQMANEAIQGGNFRNSANQQGFGQAAQAGAFNNSAHASAMADALARANLSNNARTQGLQETLALRNQPLNEFNALRSASPVNMPQFSGAANSTTNPADISGNIWNAYQGNLANWQQNQQNNNSVLSGLFGLGSAALLGPAGSLGARLFKSDATLKTDIIPIGTIGDGMGVYDYEYKDEPGVKYTGLMAQEVERKHPDAVVTTKDGYKAVDYQKVLARTLMKVA